MTHAQRLVVAELKALRRRFGGGWDYFAPEIHRALLAERILALALAQESENHARVRDFIVELARAASALTDERCVR